VKRIIVRSLHIIKILAYDKREEYQSHFGLQHQYKVSCDELDFLVDIAKAKNLVVGSRMMGGGFGGCTINLIEKNQINIFSSAVTKAYKKKFNTECSIYQVKLSNITHLVT